MIDHLFRIRSTSIPAPGAYDEASETRPRLEMKHGVLCQVITASAEFISNL